MENVTKALLIAGGVLFAILVLTLLIMFHNQLSAYYTEQHNAKMIEQVTEFNSKFDNYSGQTIRGNELISIMNRVVDYNRTYADVEGAERITININLLNHQNDLLYKGTSGTNKLFTDPTISNADGNDDDIDDISKLGVSLVKETGIEDTKLQKLSANVSFICDDKDKETRNNKIRQIFGKSGNSDSEIEGKIQNIQSATMKYYQLTQFKRSMFNCTEVVHSQRDGRINRLSFEVVLNENGEIKQD